MQSYSDPAAQSALLLTVANYLDRITPGFLPHLRVEDWRPSTEMSKKDKLHKIKPKK